jgi:hypothetical protein
MSSKSFTDSLIEGVVSDVHDEAEKKVLVRLAKKLGEQVESRLEDTVSSRVTDELAKRGLTARQVRPVDQKFRNMLAAFRNNGVLADVPGTRLTIKDMLERDVERLADSKRSDADPKRYKYEDYTASDGAFMWDQPVLLPRVISTVVREPMEPIQVLGQFFQRVRMENPMTKIEFPAISAANFGDLDVGEGDRYNEGSFEFASTVVANIGKCGVKVRLTEEMIRWSLFDVMAMHLRAAGAALARWKEQKMSTALLASGTTIFNNVGGTMTSGRDSALLFNGTFSLKDLHDMYAAAVNDGFRPDTILINPMAWTIFAMDPTMRNWAYEQGPARIWQRVQGEVAAIRQWMAGMNGSTKVDDPQQIASTFTPVPELFPYPLKLVVSPYLAYDPVNNTTDIGLVDSREVGVLTVAEEPTTTRWNDPERDIEQVKIRERYAVNILNEGRAVRWAKNVVIARSWDADDRIQLNIDGPLPTGISPDFTL